MATSAAMSGRERVGVIQRILYEEFIQSSSRLGVDNRDSDRARS
jgi:hypothetical protein